MSRSSSWPMRSPSTAVWRPASTQPSYGAQIIVEADNRTLAEHVARKLFAESAQKAGLPAWPITRVRSALSEEEDLEPNMY